MKNGPLHFYSCSRGLRLLTKDIRKLDETSNMTTVIPYQLGYITGLQEIYARRVGLVGPMPTELGELTQLRVLSMGNNRYMNSHYDYVLRDLYLLRPNSDFVERSLAP